MNSEIKFDIVKLIEKNSITRLNKDYKNKLVNKIKENSALLPVTLPTHFALNTTEKTKVYIVNIKMGLRKDQVKPKIEPL